MIINTWKNQLGFLGRVKLEFLPFLPTTSSFPYHFSPIQTPVSIISFFTYKQVSGTMSLLWLTSHFSGLCGVFVRVKLVFVVSPSDVRGVLSFTLIRDVNWVLVISLNIFFHDKRILRKTLCKTAFNYSFLYLPRLI